MGKVKKLLAFTILNASYQKVLTTQYKLDARNLFKIYTNTINIRI